MSGREADGVSPDAVEDIFVALSLRDAPPVPARPWRPARRDLAACLSGAMPDRWDEIATALAGDAALRADFSFLCSRLAVTQMPAAAAASTAALPDRPFDDGVIRQTPLAGFPGQVMVTILPRNRGAVLRLLVLERAGESLLHRPLPRPTSRGRIQFIADQARPEDARLLRLLADHATRGYFFAQ